MREPTERDVKKDIVLEKCFNCMAEKGIEGISVKDFSKATGMSASSLYYWFKDKDEIVLDSVRWGLDKNVNAIFDFAFKHTDNLNKLAKGIIQIAQDRKLEFRLIFQIATSPQYGGKVRQLADELDNLYIRYTEALSYKMKVDFDILYPYVSLVVSVFIDCIIWEDWTKFEREMKVIIDLIKAGGKSHE